jgi:hypothetical protein
MPLDCTPARNDRELRAYLYKTSIHEKRRYGTPWYIRVVDANGNLIWGDWLKDKAAARAQCTAKGWTPWNF